MKPEDIRCPECGLHINLQLDAIEDLVGYRYKSVLCQLMHQHPWFLVVAREAKQGRLKAEVCGEVHGRGECKVVVVQQGWDEVARGAWEAWRGDR